MSGSILDKISFIKNHQVITLFICSLKKLYNEDKIDSSLKDLLKGLLVKTGTVILISNNLFETSLFYTKSGLAELLNSLMDKDIKEQLLWSLYRGHRGKFCSEIIEMILNKFLIIIENNLQKIIFEWNTIEINWKIKLPVNNPLIIDTFWKSPHTCNIEFEELFKSEFPKGLLSIKEFNSYFQIPSCDKSKLSKFPEIQQQSLFINQRSNEWFEARKVKYFPLGIIDKDQTNEYNKYNFELTKSWVNDLFHLIGGCIGELNIMYGIDWTKLFPGYEFINIGLVFDDNFSSISPDGFLINNHTLDIIPIEIKVLRKGKNLYCDLSIRELRQARQQLDTLSSIMKIKPEKGIIVFLYIESDSNVYSEYTIFNLND